MVPIDFLTSKNATLLVIVEMLILNYKFFKWKVSGEGWAELFPSLRLHENFHWNGKAC